MLMEVCKEAAPHCDSGVIGDLPIGTTYKAAGAQPAAFYLYIQLETSIRKR